MKHPLNGRVWTRLTRRPDLVELFHGSKGYDKYTRKTFLDDTPVCKHNIRAGTNLFQKRIDGASLQPSWATKRGNINFLAVDIQLSRIHSGGVAKGRV